MARKKGETPEKRSPKSEAHALFGDALRTALIHRDRYANQAEAAEAGGISESRLSDWLGGQSDPHLIRTFLPAVARWKDDCPSFGLVVFEDAYDFLRPGKPGPYRLLQQENQRLREELAAAEKRLVEVEERRRIEARSRSTAGTGADSHRR